MSDRDIVRLYLDIPEDVREKIKEELTKDEVLNYRKTYKQMVLNKYVSAMAQLCGGKLELTSRLNPFVEARMVLAYVLSEKGYTESEIGEAMLKDHSTIHHYIANVRFNTEYGFNNNLTSLMKRFKEKVNDI